MIFSYRASRVWTVLIILGMLLFFNQIILPSVSLKLPQSRDFIAEGSGPDPIAGLSAEHPWFTKDLQGDLSIGQIYRVSALLNAVVAEGFEDPPLPPTQAVGLFLINDFGERSLVEEIKVEPGALRYFARSFVVKEQARWVQLEFLFKNDHYNLEINRFDIQPLNVRSLAEADQLHPLLVRSAAFTKESVAASGTPAGGRVFQVADDLPLIGVNLQLRRHGDSGRGPYQIELKDVATDKIIATDGFIAADHKAIVRRADGTVVWQFPLSAALKKGRSYQIQINGAGTKASLLNRLEIVGDTLDLYSTKPSSQAGDQLLFGAVVEDLGAGVGRYSYSSNERLNSLNSPVLHGEEGFWEYTIDTVYPYLKVMVEASVPGLVQPKIGYSLDGQIWYDAQEEINYQAGTLVSRVRLKGEGERHRFSLRVYPMDGGLLDLPPFKISASLRMP